jgi:hypothetical protein
MTKWGSGALLVTPKVGGGRGSLVLRLSMRLSLYLLVGPPAKGLLVMLKNTNLRTQKKKKLGLMLEEVVKDFLTLTLCMTSVPSGKSPNTMPPWKFGFNFDTTGYPAAWGRKRGTCMIFTMDKQSVEETPEDVLKNEEGLVANAFCGLGDEKLMGVTYKTVRMWRMVAVGYRKNDFLEG